MKLLDVQHPFFIPLWRRIATVAACIGWAGVEFWNGNAFWGVLFGGIGLFCAHQFFIAFDPKAPEPPRPPADQD
jgi:hypothetical protein